jgi:hypothetical protein
VTEGITVSTGDVPQDDPPVVQVRYRLPVSGRHTVSLTDDIDPQVVFQTEGGPVTAWVEDGWLLISGGWGRLLINPVSGNKIRLKEGE